MNKKILILFVIILVVVVGVGFGVYKYQVTAPIAQTPPVQQEDAMPTVEVVAEPGGNNGNGGLTICADKCGDGVCQNETTECTDLNCICNEDKEVCPQDC